MKKKRGLREREEKALSPIIATVLLVVLVVIIAILIFIWAKYFIGESVTKNGVGAEQTCGDISLMAEYDKAAGILYLSNQGDTTVTSVKLSIESSSGDSETRVKQLGDGLLGGGSFEITDVGSDYTKVEIIPSFMGETSSEQKEYFCKNHKIDANII